MTLTHESCDPSRDRDPSAPVLPPRAGLRNPSSPQPNGIFVVVETCVLVLVAALAMVSIIVASADAGPAPPEAAASTVATALPTALPSALPMNPESRRPGAADAPDRTR